MLYRTLASHWADFCERAEEAAGLPRFVQREVDEYLRCDLLEHGCVRVGCERCGFERLVAFSCERRGSCPSCLGRRMSDTAVHLVEKVIPEGSEVVPKVDDKGPKHLALFEHDRTVLAYPSDESCH